MKRREPKSDVRQEVKHPTSSNGQVHRGELLRQRTAAIEAWMRGTSPALSVDVMLCRPLDALEMALSVAQKLELVPAGVLERMLKKVRSLATENPDHVRMLNDICRAAMNDRKRGLLKPSARAARPRRRLASTPT